jgi:hypothetical protein
LPAWMANWGPVNQRILIDLRVHVLKVGGL